MFRAIYGYPIELGDFEQTQFADMIRKAVDVIDVAEYLGVVRTFHSLIFDARTGELLYSL